MNSGNQKSPVNGQSQPKDGPPRAENVYRGFTLPELMIAIAVLVIISLIAVLSFRGFDSMSKLRGARDEIINDLLDMQSFAQSGKLVNVCVMDIVTNTIDNAGANRGICAAPEDCTSGKCGVATPPGGYGVYFYDNTTYILYADIFNTDSENGYNETANIHEALIGGAKTLSGNINFNDGKYRYLSEGVGGYETTIFPAQVIFSPDNKIFIKWLHGSCLSPCVEKIQLASSGNSASVYVNTVSGLIYGDQDSQEPAGSP